MKKLFDLMVAAPMALLVMMNPDGPPLQTLITGLALLAIMTVGAYLGGYIVGTAPHRRRKEEREDKL